MALLRGVASSTKPLLSIPSNSVAYSTNHALSLTHLHSPRNLDAKRLRIKWSSDYRDNPYNQPLEYPKPPEIQWNKDLCNSVHLIGTVGTPVEIKHLSSGKVLAWTRLAVKKSATDTTWINLTFWDELAQVASQHVEKGNQIYVAGRLISDIVENDEGKQHTYYKVVVQQLNFIQRSSASSPSSPSYDGGSDNVTSRKFSNNGATGVGVTELWQAFFANPSEWWDNRNNKRNPKYPDFKHKDTGEALWVEGRNNPAWVKSQLEVLDERMGSLQNQESRMHLSSFSGDDLMRS
ncbi:Single-stranded DNA-binding protein [Euphorbia peplus]|nr:Single-stranded DNA-binding protein [Euphorbia peplus]